MLRVLRVLPLGLLAAFGISNAGAGNAFLNQHVCELDGSLCTETEDSIGYWGAYTGHDEPSLLFYSNVPGSGNNMTYHLKLPADPPTPPNQLATGGTWNFQLHPTFWVGMTMCDDQSAPNPGGSVVNGVTLPQVTCQADSDANIYDNATLTDPHYIGMHPGTGFMEMQFYPPSSPIGCGNLHHPTQWCAALNIDSASENQNAGTLNNLPCLEQYGEEYVNYAFITQSGTPEGPSALVGSAGFFGFVPSDNDTLFMNSGDNLVISMSDTAHGLQIVIHDLTTGQTGSMVASAANGFSHPLFQPSASSCTTQTADFHPAFSTSTVHTRSTWTAHSYGIAFSDELGHYEYCNAIDDSGGFDAAGDGFGNCTEDGVHDLNTNGNEDDFGCVDTTENTVGYPANIGCTSTDIDFDGAPYQPVWPGTNPNVAQDRLLHSTPISFQSPTFRTASGQSQNYSTVAFENNFARIEAADFGGSCNRTTGAGCTDPAPNVNFYPIYTIQGGGQNQNGNSQGNGCRWSLGGAYLPGTTNTFGGNVTAEYGADFPLLFPGTAGPRYIIEDFRNTLKNNPCPAGS